MSEITRETPSQRLHYRLSVPIQVEVEGKLYKAADWSMGGFRLDGYDGPLQKDEIFNPKLLIDFRGFHISFHQSSRAVRTPRDGDGMLAVQFEDITEENLELLKYFSEGLLGGEMASFQDAIRRVDMPVTPVDMELIEEATAPPLRRSIKRILILLAYLLIGGGILAYICITLYANFMRIEVESGVVVAPTEPLVAPVSGIFEKLIIPLDRSVKTGMPVIKLTSLDGNGGFGGGNTNAMIALNTARFRLSALLAQRDAEYAARGIYGKVGDSRLTSATDRVAAISQDLALAKNDLARRKSLESQSVISRSEMEAEQQLVEKLENELAAAKNELRIAHVALSGLNRSGLFFSGDRIEGRGQGLRGEIAAARKSVAELEGNLGGMGSRGGGGGGGGAGADDLLLIRAPFDGHVVRVLKTPGNTVDRGDNLAVLERDDSRYIEAFLTQAESTQVRLGSVAKVFIPSLNIEREARVIQIERTRGFVDETDSRYRWRTTVDRTAVATLFFVKDGKNLEVKDIVTGTPCTVNFTRNPSNPILAGIFNFFRSNAAKTEEAAAANQAMTYEFREVVRMQGPTSKRTEAGTMVTVPASSQNAASPAVSGQNATSPAVSGQKAAVQPVPAQKAASQPAPGQNVWPVANSACKDGQSLLWPGRFPTQIKPEALTPPARAQLKSEADKALKKAPAPVKTLASAGQTDKESPEFTASRRAFQDADSAANLALGFRVLGERKYLDQAMAILLAWAKTNKPTGHPIDETRLDKMVHAFDLIRCEMSEADRATVLGWFAQMRDAKLTWKYGAKTQNNNHRTHQLKMILLLARALGDGASFDKAAAEAQAHLRVNIDAATGETLDHKERNALHYQAYALEPWLEIALITGCCKEPVVKAYEFLRDKIAKGDINYEFAKSTAPIDEKRAKAGFEYAKKGGTFDTQKAVRALLAYQTLNSQDQTPAMAGLLKAEATSGNLFFLIRQQAWRR